MGDSTVVLCPLTSWSRRPGWLWAAGMGKDGEKGAKGQGTNLGVEKEQEAGRKNQKKGETVQMKERQMVGRGERVRGEGSWGAPSTGGKALL